VDRRDARDGWRSSPAEPALVTNETWGAVSVVALPEHQNHQDLEAGGGEVRPMGIAVTPDSKTLFPAHRPSGDVSMVDAESLTERWHIKVGNEPLRVRPRPRARVNYTAAKAARGPCQRRIGRENLQLRR
jgi:DNA-binding beta-propeller fold protein YncE